MAEGKSVRGGGEGQRGGEGVREKENLEPQISSKPNTLWPEPKTITSTQYRSFQKFTARSLNKQLPHFLYKT